RVELARRNLFQRGGVEHEVHALQRLPDTAFIADIANVEAKLRIVECNPHVLLLLLVATEDANLAHIGVEKPLENGIAERACAPGYKKRLVSEHRHFPA